MRDKLKKIKVLALDVDGVLTDGKIIIDGKGGEIKNFHVRDGYGLVICRSLGFKTVLITARRSKAVHHRAKDLRFDKVYQGAYPKIGAYQKMLRELKVKHQEVCFMGDDLPDLPVLRQVGLAVAVPDAPAEVKRAADYVTKRRGGDGAVREVIELILKAQGKWKRLL